MAIAGRTREQLRVSIGHNLGAIHEGATTTTASDASSVLDTSLAAVSSTGSHDGKWIIAVEGSNDGAVTRVDSTSVSSGVVDMTVSPLFGYTVPTSMSYELWDAEYPPARIHDFINRAILDTYGLTYDPVVDTSLHSDGRQARFDIPTGFSMLTKVQYRSQMLSEVIHRCDNTFDETATDTDFTQYRDDEDYKQGGQSLRLTIGGSISDDDFLTDSITAVDISRYTHLEGWIKSSTTLAAGDFVIRLDNGVVQGDGSDLQVLSVPIVSTADTWTHFQVALTTPITANTEIVSVGIEFNAHSGAKTVWFDDLRVTANNTDIWKDIPNHLWSIDKPNRQLLLTSDGVGVAGYHLLRLVGGDEPLLLTSDSDATEIDDEYVIAQATALAFSAASGGPSTDPDNLRSQAGFWFSVANRRKKGFPMLTDVRRIE